MDGLLNFLALFRERWHDVKCSIQSEYIPCIQTLQIHLEQLLIVERHKGNDRISQLPDLKTFLIHQLSWIINNDINKLEKLLEDLTVVNNEIRQKYEEVKRNNEIECQGERELEQVNKICPPVSELLLWCDCCFGSLIALYAEIDFHVRMLKLTKSLDLLENFKHLLHGDKFAEKDDIESILVKVDVLKVKS